MQPPSRDAKNTCSEHAMKKNTLPALGIVLVTLILLVINEFTESTVIRDYAFLFIIGGMLLGVFLTKLGDRSKN